MERQVRIKKKFIFLFIICLFILWRPVHRISQFIDDPFSEASKKIWHYRMTVSVDTPEGIRTGSVVRKVIYGGDTAGGGGSGVDLECAGEAAIVDLGERGVLFASTGGYSCADLLVRAFDKEGSSGLRIDAVPDQGSVQLKQGLYPEFLRFRNLDDPKTIQRVADKPAIDVLKQAMPKGDIISFEQAFGSNVKISQITIEITKDPVTRKIDDFLPWLAKRSQEKGPFGSDPAKPDIDPTGLYIDGTDFSYGNF